MRKVIQISASNGAIAALCNDGTAWLTLGKAWAQLPPIPQPEIADDVVMPKVGDAIFVRNHEDLGYEHYVFDRFEKMNVLCLDGGATWDLWRLNLHDPWRDATGKVVEV